MARGFQANLEAPAIPVVLPEASEGRTDDKATRTQRGGSEMGLSAATAHDATPHKFLVQLWELIAAYYRPTKLNTKARATCELDRPGAQCWRGMGLSKETTRGATPQHRGDSLAY
jgi:hypothetical protein